ncbi:hypothetical protein [Nocardia sp. NPDC056000]|uniref:hypothetical protein n=1 Tax=Nocardia sp. NPDC056000 TaxID=3345674 RepID=UPI0035E0E19C
MESEHEEAMRAEFTARTKLMDSIYAPGVTEDRCNQICDDVDVVDERWTQGPHSAQWQYLSDCHTDWRDRPETMQRFLDNVEHNRARGWDAGLDEVQRRSQYQARELTAPQRIRRRGPVQRER